MTRQIKLFSKFLFCLGLSAGMLAVTAAAQAQTRVQATIPFAFTANKVAFPAGTYKVTRDIQSPAFLQLTNVKTGRTKMLMVRADSGTHNAGPARLTFHRQPGGIYLSQVWTSDASLHSELISHPKPSKEMAKSSPEIATFEIATLEVLAR